MSASPSVKAAFDAAIHAGPKAQGFVVMPEASQAATDGRGRWMAGSGPAMTAFQC
jgi:hypothetical protein